MTDLVHSLPKAELHVHLGGTITPQFALKKAQESGLDLADDLFAPDRRSYQWRDFVDLVTRVYDGAASIMRSKQDFADVAYDYLRRCAAENVIYVEIIVSYAHGVKVGVGYEDMIAGIADGIDRARAETAIEARLNSTLVRHMSDADLRDAVDHITGYRHPYIVGIDLAGAEQEGDVARFVPFIEDIRTRTQGELKIRLHAGENAGPRNIRDSLLLNPLRIGHGVRVIEDVALMSELVARGIALEVCPTSNILAGIYEDYAHHPLRRLYDAGVKVTINSDDPGLFGATVGDEYRLAHDKFGFSADELRGITRTAIEVSFAPEELKVTLLKNL